MPTDAFAPLNRRLHKAPVNVMDKTTIVSIFPKDIYSLNHTIFPGEFTVPKGSYEKPGILVVGPSSWWKEMEDLNQDPFEVTVGSLSVADSIIKDWAAGLVGCDMSGSMPGIFYVNGDHNLISIKKEFKANLDLAAEKQKNYYKTLVEFADVLWATYQGSPRAVSADMRMAAEELQMKDKPWMKDSQTFSMENCPACGSLRNPLFPICPNCKTVVDKEKAKLLGLSA